MNKSELVNAIAAGAGLSKADAKKALDVTLSAIAAAKIEAPGYPNLLPKPPAASAKPAAKAIESKPVEVKPAAKPAAKAIESKPVEAKK